MVYLILLSSLIFSNSRIKSESLKLDPLVGEVFGTIDRQLEAETTYTFTVGATKSGTGYTDHTYSKTFTLTVRGAAYGTVTFDQVEEELVI